MRIKSFIFSIASVLVLSFTGCDKLNGGSSEAENWKGWEGLKELMEQSGFSSKGIKPSHSISSDWFFMSDVRSTANAWCGTKNGEPWVGLGHIVTGENTPQTYFDNEFVWKGHKAPETSTFDQGYGQSVTGSYSGSQVGFILIDKEYYYLIIGDRYVVSNYEFSVGSTLLFVRKDGQVVAQIDDYHNEGSGAVNVGYEHDLLIGNVCYSINGQKLYDIPNNLTSLYGAAHSLERVSTPLDHKNFVLMESWLHTYFNTETGMHEYQHAINVNFTDLSGENGTSQVQLYFDGDSTDRLDRFELVSKTNNILTYEIEFTKYSGEKLKRQIKVDSSKQTAELI